MAVNLILTLKNEKHKFLVYCNNFQHTVISGSLVCNVGIHNFVRRAPQLSAENPNGHVM